MSRFNRDEQRSDNLTRQGAVGFYYNYAPEKNGWSEVLLVFISTFKVRYSVVGK
jgi:hypothetical protein